MSNIFVGTSFCMDEMASVKGDALVSATEKPSSEDSYPKITIKEDGTIIKEYLFGLTVEEYTSGFIVERHGHAVTITRNNQNDIVTRQIAHCGGPISYEQYKNEEEFLEKNSGFSLPMNEEIADVHINYLVYNLHAEPSNELNKIYKKLFCADRLLHNIPENKDAIFDVWEKMDYYKKHDFYIWIKNEIEQKIDNFISITTVKGTLRKSHCRLYSKFFPTTWNFKIKNIYNRLTQMEEEEWLNFWRSYNRDTKKLEKEVRACFKDVSHEKALETIYDIIDILEQKRLDITPNKELLEKTNKNLILLKEHLKIHPWKKFSYQFLI